MKAFPLGMISVALALGCSDDLSVITPRDAAVADRPAAMDTPRSDTPGVDTPEIPMDAPPGADVPRPPTDAPAPPDAPADVPAAPTDASSAAAPPFDAATQAHVHDLLTRGATLGNRPDVFAKIGDSITESGSFLIDCGTGDFDLGAFPSLDSTIAYFSRVTFPDLDGTGSVNSFSRHSLCAMGGWVSSQAITPYMGESTPRLLQEITALRPAWALVEYGTNDVLVADWSDPTAHPETEFTANLGTILDMVEARGVVPIVYTIPPLLSTASEPRPDSTLRGVDTINRVIRSAASSRHLPLIEFHDALEMIPGVHGLDTDGIHPTAFMGSNACILTAAALRNGYNLRNLITLQMLARAMVTR